jgi:protein-tyrosine phosphatase
VYKNTIAVDGPLHALGFPLPGVPYSSLTVSIDDVFTRQLAYYRYVRICFVCLGNICRSPTAEAVMRRLVEEVGLDGRVTLDSAGLSHWHVGELADSRTRSAAANRGIAISHRARQFTAADLERFDLVIAMDQENLAGIRRLMRGRNTPAVQLLRSFDPSSPEGAEVPDPYTGGPEGFDYVLDVCECACRGLVEFVQGQLSPSRAPR